MAKSFHFKTLFIMLYKLRVTEEKTSNNIKNMVHFFDLIMSVYIGMCTAIARWCIKLNLASKNIPSIYLRILKFCWNKHAPVWCLKLYILCIIPTFRQFHWNFSKIMSQFPATNSTIQTVLLISISRNFTHSIVHVAVMVDLLSWTLVLRINAMTC